MNLFFSTELYSREIVEFNYMQYYLTIEKITLGVFAFNLQYVYAVVIFYILEKSKNLLTIISVF